MKAIPVLLLLIGCAAAHAQPVYRCLDDAGQLAYQDVACAAQSTSAQPAAAPSGSGAPSVLPAAAVHVAYADETGYTQGGWTDQQRWQRRREMKLEWRAEALRIGQLLQPASDRNAAAYASNNQRCRRALQIAALCGTAGRPFSCDAKGFHYEPAAEAAAPSLSAVVDHASPFKRQQCALQMSRGR